MRYLHFILCSVAVQMSKSEEQRKFTTFGELGPTFQSKCTTTHLCAVFRPNLCPCQTSWSDGMAPMYFEFQTLQRRACFCIISRVQKQQQQG